MAYRKKTTRKSYARKAYPKRRKTTRKAAPRTQTIRLELHHVMGTPQAVPVLGEGGALQAPTASAKKQPKL